jgi:ABC-type siderophore export system fused ATPase/permease subunit
MIPFFSPTNPPVTSTRERANHYGSLCSSCRKLGKTLILVSHDRLAMSTADSAFELGGNLDEVHGDVANSIDVESQVTRHH